MMLFLHADVKNGRYRTLQFHVQFYNVFLLSNYTVFWFIDHLI